MCSLILAAFTEHYKIAFGLQKAAPSIKHAGIILCSVKVFFFLLALSAVHVLQYCATVTALFKSKDLAFVNGVEYSCFFLKTKLMSLVKLLCGLQGTAVCHTFWGLLLLPYDLVS